MNYKTHIYDSYRSAFKGEGTEEQLQFAASKVRPVLVPWVVEMDRSARVLDLGCGAGELLRVLDDLGFRNLGGCDLSAEQIAIAAKRFPNVQVANLFAFLEAQPENSVDLITIFDVVEHLGPQSTFDLMALIVTRLAPGGRLIVHLPNGLSPLVGHVFWSDMTHEWCLTPQSAQTLCTLFGLMDFAAVEHLGTGSDAKGQLRALAWRGMRTLFRAMNFIETGNFGGTVWTRNFAFKSDKPSGS